jgi:hypothetical protein
MNRHVASSETHVAVTHRPGDVPMLSWTKIRRLPSMKSEKNGISTIYGPISSLQKNHLAPVLSVVDNDKPQ